MEDTQHFRHIILYFKKGKNETEWQKNPPKNNNKNPRVLYAEGAGTD